jgi:hypothetical protein
VRSNASPEDGFDSVDGNGHVSGNVSCHAYGSAVVEEGVSMSWQIKRELISATILLGLVILAEWLLGIGWFSPEWFG